MVYMPTIALNNGVSYKILTRSGLDVVAKFPPIRVWGTVGFIVAMWLVDLLGWSRTPLQLCLGWAAALVLGVYAFTMPKCPPANGTGTSRLRAVLGLDAFVLFRRGQM